MNFNETTNSVLLYAINRLTEASTLRGLLLSISSTGGIIFTTSQQNNLIFIILIIVGLVGASLPDNFRDLVSKNVNKNIDEIEKTLENQS